MALKELFRSISVLSGRSLLKPRLLWIMVLILGIVILLGPLTSLLTSILGPVGNEWDHISQYLLAHYIQQSIILVIGVLVLSSLFAIPAAWFMSQYKFFTKPIFEILLVIPLAIPPYIQAFSYKGLFDFGGSIHNLLIFISNDAQITAPDISTMAGLIFIMSSVLFPYLYLPLRVSFQQQSSQQIEVAKSLGASESKIFFLIALPASRAVLVGGLSIITMETVNEYGAAFYYGIDTLTVGVFKSWYQYYDLASAQRIGALVFYAILVILSLEYFSRGKTKLASSDSHKTNILSRKLKTLQRSMVQLFLSILILISCILPLIQLFHWAGFAWERFDWQRGIHSLLNSFGLGVLASTIMVSASIFIAYARRIIEPSVIRKVSRAIDLGHSIPGAVIAMALLTSATAFFSFFGINRSILGASIVGIVLALCIKFFSVAHRPMSQSLEFSHITIDEAGRSLGLSPFKTLMKIHIPMIKPLIVSSFLLCFLDVIKELPMTMVLRPFNFSTLAIYSYEKISNEQLQIAAIPALTIVALGTIILISLRFLTHSKKGLRNGQ